MKSKLLLALAGLLIVSMLVVSPVSAPPPVTKILVDASRGGGTWWSPQHVGEEDPDLPHQGKALADYMRSLGHFVDELPRGAITIDLDLLRQYDMVIAVASFGFYSSDETEAYQSYVRRGGALLLLTDHHGVDLCNLPLSFELDYRGTSVGSNVVNSFVEHPITSGVSTLTYGVGSGLISYPSDANLIGWLTGDTFIDLNYNGMWESDEPVGAPVLGYMDNGAGKIVFFGDVNGAIELVEQPFTENYLNWLLEPIGRRGPPEEILERVQNAKFIDWPIDENVIHVLGWLGIPRTWPWEGGTVATLGRGSPILFGFEVTGDMSGLWDFKTDPDYNLRLKIDGFVVADNLWRYWQDPFVAQPGVGPDWTWDHDGDGLGDGNGNGVDDWDGPHMFWRFEIRPRLSLGDHIWGLEETDDNGLTWFLLSDGILRIVE